MSLTEYPIERIIWRTQKVLFDSQNKTNCKFWTTEKCQFEKRT